VDAMVASLIRPANTRPLLANFVKLALARVNCACSFARHVRACFRCEPPPRLHLPGVMTATFVRKSLHSIARGVTAGGFTHGSKLGVADGAVRICCGPRACSPLHRYLVRIRAGHPPPSIRLRVNSRSVLCRASRHSANAKVSAVYARLRLGA